MARAGRRCHSLCSRCSDPERPDEQGLAQGQIPIERQWPSAFAWRRFLTRGHKLRVFGYLTPQSAYPKTKSGPHFSFAKPWDRAVPVEGIAVENLAPLKKTPLNRRHASLLADYVPVGDDCGGLIIDNRASLRL